MRLDDTAHACMLAEQYKLQLLANYTTSKLNCYRYTLACKKIVIYVPLCSLCITDSLVANISRQTSEYVQVFYLEGWSLFLVIKLNGK
jgi:hypothetical protein